MNSIVLMAEIVTEPEMRYTPDNLAVSSLLVSFPSSRQGEPDAQVRVAAFGETAQQVVDNFAVGDRVTIEGQLHINTVERDGRNEKRAEISARRIYKVSGEFEAAGASDRSASSGASSSRPRPSTPKVEAPAAASPAMDEIPF
ncbi:single-stranded DNA-binding protein [Synechococcus sp. PCC 7336]|uniref:single-stranded DNA-binding protein n=1 Tax=Synechococcus sp. PCC 7336 TaxID=195250 RepID=UPI00034A58BA|nr:single-stranded DNA-binding protein [Synechococcus sp. PCC 7336]